MFPYLNGRNTSTSEIVVDSRGRKERRARKVEDVGDEEVSARLSNLGRCFHGGVCRKERNSSLKATPTVFVRCSTSRWKQSEVALHHGNGLAALWCEEFDTGFAGPWRQTASFFSTVDDNSQHRASSTPSVGQHLLAWVLAKRSNARSTFGTYQLAVP